MSKAGLLVVSLVTLCANCSDQKLTGPEAQEAFVRALRQPGFHPDSVLFVVNGTPLPDARVLRATVDPKTITGIAVVKGAAAERLYGPRARIGVILLTTARPDSAERRPPN